MTRSRIAVIGSGPTGMLTSTKLSKYGFDVTLFEAGNFESEGKILKRNSYQFSAPSAIPSDVHRYGGGSNLWYGRYGEFLDSDFDSNQSRDRSWPFGKKELSKFYKEAFEALGDDNLLDSEFIDQNFQDLKNLLPKDFQIRLFRFATPNKLKNECNNLVNQNKMKIYFDSNCLRIDKEDLESEKYSITFVNSSGESKVQVFDAVVVAGGALQSAGILLRSPELLNFPGSRFVGRGLMEHFDGFVGDLVIKGRTNILKAFSLTRWRKIRGSTLNVGIGIQLCDEISKLHNLPGMQLEICMKRTKYWFSHFADSKSRVCNWIFFFERVVKKGFWSIKQFFLKIQGKSAYSIWLKGEEYLNEDSSVQLDQNDPDKFKLIYAHKISKKTSDEIKRGLKIFGQVLAENDLGQFKLDSSVLNPENLYLGPNWHPMGTLRMGSSVENSVCDENLKLHGTSSVYIASAAVFPTGSSSNPTATALALSCRLASHLNTSIK